MHTSHQTTDSQKMTKSVLMQIYIKQNIHKHQTEIFLRISPFGISPVKKAHEARTCWCHGPFHLFINTRLKKKSIKKEWREFVDSYIIMHWWLWQSFILKAENDISVCEWLHGKALVIIPCFRWTGGECEQTTRPTSYQWSWPEADGCAEHSHQSGSQR